MAQETRDKATIDFDHTSPEYAERGDEITRDLRSRCPVAYTEHHGGFWLVSDYESFARGMRDDATFSSLHTAEAVDGIKYWGVNIPEAPYQNALLEMDPPEWNVFRRILNPIFAPPVVDRLQPQVLEFTTTCIDAVIESGTVDFVEDIANPVPAMATLLVLGLPLEDWRSYAEPAHEVVFTRPGTPEFTKAVEGQQWMFEAVSAAVAERRGHPTDDPIGQIIAAEIDGRRLTDEEIVSMLGTIINGGVDTTTSLLANAVEYLDRNRDTRQQLIDHPEMLPDATEEFLRYFSPVQAFSRTIAEDVELAGQQLERGDRVLMSFASANRDESEFPDAEEFIVDRFPNRHVAFGLGKHRCIGSTLARHEFTIMLGQILARMPDYEIDRSGAERYPSTGIVNGWISMPGTFTPGPRLQ